MSLGEQIRIRLKANNITQNELARRAGLSSSGISTIINDSYDPRLGNLRLIARELHCTVGDLLEETNGENRANTAGEIKLLDAAHRLNTQGVNELIRYADVLSGNPLYTQETPAESAI